MLYFYCKEHEKSRLDEQNILQNKHKFAEICMTLVNIYGINKCYSSFDFPVFS